MSGGIHVIAEVDADGSLKRSYTWGPGIDNLLAMTTGYGESTTNHYYFITSVPTFFSCRNGKHW